MKRHILVCLLSMAAAPALAQSQPGDTSSSAAVTPPAGQQESASASDQGAQSQASGEQTAQAGQEELGPIAQLDQESLAALKKGGDVQAEDSQADKVFKVLDRNNDQALSEQELGGGNLPDRVASLDKNGDGKLSQQEYVAGAYAEPASMTAAAGEEASDTPQQSQGNAAQPTGEPSRG